MANRHMKRYYTLLIRMANKINESVDKAAEKTGTLRLLVGM